MIGTRAETEALRERARLIGITGKDWVNLKKSAIRMHRAVSPAPLSATDWLDVLLTNIERKSEESDER